MTQWAVGSLIAFLAVVVAYLNHRRGRDSDAAVVQKGMVDSERAWLDQRIEVLDHLATHLREDNDAVRGRFSTLEAEFASLKDRFDAVVSELAVLSELLKARDQRIEQLEAELARVHAEHGGEGSG